jgi:zinc-ribbon domain
VRSSPAGKNANVPEQPANCSTCSAPLPQGAKFCPSCGAAVSSGDTLRADLPAHETTSAPASVEWSSPRWFGVAPATALLAVTVVLVAVAFVLLLLERWVEGLLTLGFGLLCAAAFLEAGRRRPDTPVVKKSVGALDSARARAGATAQTLRARSSARREIARRRGEAMQLADQRTRLVQALGEATLRGEDGAAERQQIAALDERRAELEREAGEIAQGAEARVAEARLAVQETVVRPVRDD